MKRKNFQLNWASTLALVVSFAALITTIYEANILKAQQQALVWPHFEVGEHYNGQGFGFRAKNSGTGPAIITSVGVKYDGENVGSFMDILDIMYPDSTINYYGFTYRSLNNTVYSSGEIRDVFFMKWNDTSREAVANGGSIEFKIEYRSVLGDYWVYDSEQGTHTEGRFKSPLEFSSSR